MAQLESDEDEEAESGEGEIRQSGRLVFNEMESEDEGGRDEGEQRGRGQDLPRQRTTSNGSEQIGRFEVSFEEGPV